MSGSSNGQWLSLRATCCEQVAGAINIGDSILKISDSTFSWNAAVSRAYPGCHHHGLATHSYFWHCVVNFNCQRFGPGAVAWAGSHQAAFTRCWFIGNSCGAGYIQGYYLDGSGGAIWATGPISLNECTFRHNSAAGSGGAIYATTGAIIAAYRCLFHANAAGIFGGAIYSTAPLSVGGNSSFSSCAALENGAAVYSMSEADISATVVRDFLPSNTPTAVFDHDPLDQSVLALRDVTFREVELLFVASSQPSTVVVSNCDFSLTDIDDVTSFLTCDDPEMPRYCSSDHCTDATVGIEVLLLLFNIYMSGPPSD